MFILEYIHPYERFHVDWSMDTSRCALLPYRTYVVIILRPDNLAVSTQKLKFCSKSKKTKL